METRAIYELLAGLFSYPGDDYPERATRAAQALDEFLPEAAAGLRAFSRRIADLSTEELQELYTQTFDLNPVCSLEVGWHLYGENYDRGDFLVKMRRELARHGLKESGELPDHLSHLLALLGRMEPADREKLASLVQRALDKMLVGMQAKENPFENVLESVARWIESQCPRRAGNARAALALPVLNERGLP